MCHQSQKVTSGHLFTNFKKSTNWAQKLDEARDKAFEQASGGVPDVCNGASCKYVKKQFFGNPSDLEKVRYINNKGKKNFV
jgi:hypothetical protein